MIIETIIGSLTLIFSSSLWFAKYIMNKEADIKLAKEKNEQAIWLMQEQEDEKKNHLVKMNELELENKKAQSKIDLEKRTIQNQIEVDNLKKEAEINKNCRIPTLFEYRLQILLNRRAILENKIDQMRINGYYQSSIQALEELNGLTIQEKELLKYIAEENKK